MSLSFAEVYRIVQAHGGDSLLNVWEHSEDTADQALADLLRPARSVISRRPSELPGQIAGRLPQPGISPALVDEIRAHKGEAWLEPTARCFYPSGEVTPLFRSRIRHSDFISDMLVLPGKRLVSVSEDCSLKVTDLSTGALLRTI